jgi:hypothetical protein
VAWSADGREIWYTSATHETHWPLKVIDPDVSAARDGRTVWYVPRDLLVMDIDARGRALLSGNDPGGVTVAGAFGDTADRKQVWDGWTVPGSVGRDGRTVLVSSMDGTESDYSLMLRSLDGSPGVKIGRGRAQDLSADGNWALSITPSEPHQVLLFPTGAGEPRTIDVGDLVPNAATFVTTGLAVAVVGARKGVPAAVIVEVATGQTHTIDLAELRGRLFSLNTVVRTHASPDGALLAIQADDGDVVAWPVNGNGQKRELAKLGSAEAFVGWTDDRARIYVASWTGARAHIDTLEIRTGRRQTLRELVVDDPAGMLTLPELHLSADGRSYAYGFTRMLSTLYLVTGLR